MSDKYKDLKFQTLMWCHLGVQPTNQSIYTTNTTLFSPGSSKYSAHRKEKSAQKAANLCKFWATASQSTLVETEGSSLWHMLSLESIIIPWKQLPTLKRGCTAGSCRNMAIPNTSEIKCVRRRWVTVWCMWKSEERTQILASNQSYLSSDGRKMGLSGPGVWLIWKS